MINFTNISNLVENIFFLLLGNNSERLIYIQSWLEDGSLSAAQYLAYYFETPAQGSFLFYFSIGFILFLIGLYGLTFLRSNLISLLLSVELMFLGLSLAFVTTYLQYPYDFQYAFKFGTGVEPYGVLMAFIFLALAAAESAIGLALIVLVFQQFQNLNVSNFRALRG